MMKTPNLPERPERPGPGPGRKKIKVAEYTPSKLTVQLSIWRIPFTQRYAGLCSHQAQAEAQAEAADGVCKSRPEFGILHTSPQITATTPRLTAKRACYAHLEEVIKAVIPPLDVPSTIPRNQIHDAMTPQPAPTLAGPEVFPLQPLTDRQEDDRV
jgi:hypothetical protein